MAAAISGVLYSQVGGSWGRTSKKAFNLGFMSGWSLWRRVFPHKSRFHLEDFRGQKDLEAIGDQTLNMCSETFPNQGIQTAHLRN